MIYSFIALLFSLSVLCSCSVHEKQTTPFTWCGIIQSVDKQKDGRYTYILQSQNTSTREVVKLVHPHFFAHQTMICLEG